MSSYPFNPQGPQENEIGQGSSHLDSASVNVSFGALEMVHLYTQPQFKLPAAPDTISQEQGLILPLESLHLSAWILAVWTGTMHCSVEVQNILVESWKLSTMLTYGAKWKWFSIWTSHHNFHSMASSIPVILNYLLLLKHSGLFNSSVKVHLAAISAAILQYSVT